MCPPGWSTPASGSARCPPPWPTSPSLRPAAAPWKPPGTGPGEPSAPQPDPDDQHFQEPQWPTPLHSYAIGSVPAMHTLRRSIAHAAKVTKPTPLLGRLSPEMPRTIHRWTYAPGRWVELPAL